MSNLGCKYKHFEKNYAIKWQFFVQMELYAKAVPRKMERFPAGMENCFLCNPRRLVTHTLRKRHKPPRGTGGSKLHSRRETPCVRRGQSYFIFLSV